MATAIPEVQDNGGAAATPNQIEVENPATGRVIASVDVVSAQQLAELVARARAAQPGWEALGFEGRAAVLKRAQRWMIDNTDRVVQTIVSETGKAWDEA